MLKKVSVVFFSLILFLSFSNIFAQKATYIGTKKCKMCHTKDGTHKKWESSKHATAFKTLKSEESKKLAKGKAADKEANCIACHVISVDKKDMYEEGVGCESCHGPGSLYMKMDVMKDKAKAKAAGLVMNKDAKTCEKCHNKKSPTFKSFKFNEAWGKIAHEAKKG
jgi:nitrate/TMAO reductase-like tetraheme cytochrome c subunit